MCRHSDGAFVDLRLDLVICDGAEFFRNTDQRFDIIMVDSTDPFGPGEGLFTNAFYSGCKRCLMAFGRDSEDTGQRTVSRDILEVRYRPTNVKTRYYNPAMRQISSALTQYLAAEAGKSC